MPQRNRNKDKNWSSVESLWLRLGVGDKTMKGTLKWYAWHSTNNSIVNQRLKENQRYLQKRQEGMKETGDLIERIGLW